VAGTGAFLPGCAGGRGQRRGPPGLGHHRRCGGRGEWAAAYPTSCVAAALGTGLLAALVMYYVSATCRCADGGGRRRPLLLWLLLRGIIAGCARNATTP
jgi:hypothetical protein